MTAPRKTALTSPIPPAPLPDEADDDAAPFAATAPVPAPLPAPVDPASESVAGEEDPGAADDPTAAPPQRPQPIDDTPL